MKEAGGIERSEGGKSGSQQHLIHPLHGRHYEEACVPVV